VSFQNKNLDQRSARAINTAKTLAKAGGGAAGGAPHDLGSSSGTIPTVAVRLLL
jgi:hypothetical protein